MKPTVSTGKPREAGAHGVTLTMRAIEHPEPAPVHAHRFEGTKLFGRVVGSAYVNQNKDRRLPGKARRRARRAAREVVAGFICSCGARAYLTAGATEQHREWFDGLYDAHEGCEVSA